MTEPTLSAKVLEVDRQLDEAGCVHALGGALALAYHVESPRATSDIDLNISVPVEDCRSVLEALAEVSWSEADVETIRRVGQVRVYWGRTPVDLFFPQHDLHAVAAARAERHPFAGRQLPFLSATDLTVFKALFDRTKDWPDIEEMIRFGEVDQREVVAWLTRIVGADDPRMGRFADAVTRAAAARPVVVLPRISPPGATGPGAAG